MAQSGAGNQPQNISIFPPPPIFAEHYTSDNIRKGLVLPPPPVPSKFDVFGESYDLEGPLLPSLNDLGCQQLYSASGNWRSELLKLNRSLVAAFLDLIEILIKCPDHEDRQEKINTIRTLFINIHHLINEYRPVQARDTLRQMIKHQNAEISRVTEKLNKYTEMGSAALETLNSALRNFVLDEQKPPPPPKCFEGGMAMEVDSGDDGGEESQRHQQQPSTSAPSPIPPSLQLPKPIELNIARLMRRDIAGGGAGQILNKFHFL